MHKDELKQKALEQFTDYFVRNYPGPDTVILNPKWHAPKIFDAAYRALSALVEEQPVAALAEQTQQGVETSPRVHLRGDHPAGCVEEFYEGDEVAYLRDKLKQANERERLYGVRITSTYILREWFGGERYARDHEYLDANYRKPAQQVVDWLSSLAASSQTIQDIRSALVDVPAAEPEPVGAVGEMPGSNGGFTMAAFKAVDVPIGTKLYASPVRSAIAPAPAVETWQPIETAPKDGSKFDVWCVNPQHSEAYGVRFNNVQMRGDGSGFGFVMYLRDGVYWQYLDAREPDSILPAWQPTHWHPLPAPPSLVHAEDGMAHGSATAANGGSDA